MPRNGSGVYSVPNTFTPNTVMSATAVNQNFTDAGNELSNSLARDGQSIMTGQFKAADGSEAAPGIAFGSDTNTGFRRASSDEMRWVGGGQDRFYIDSVGKAWFLSDVSVGGVLNINGGLTGTSIPDLQAIEALTGTGALKRTGDATWALDDGSTMLSFLKDGYGNVIGTGVIGDMTVPFACTITAAYLLADQTGSITVDIWKDTYANFPPTNADSITSASPPSISSGIKSENTSLSGWTTAIAAGDILRFNVDSCSAITRVGIYLKVTRY